MTSYSSNQAVERAQPWLGTLVRIRVGGLATADAHRAIDAAFEEVATVHSLMSFHRPDSDISRLNAHAHRNPVAVHPWTFDVLRWALRFSQCSDGCFDVSVASQLVDWRLLPAPSSVTDASLPRMEGSWRDIELRPDGKVRFRRLLWIDLGGIAKGYAVDRATESLRRNGASLSVVNAGGDIRVSGSDTERIALNTGLRRAAPQEFFRSSSWKRAASPAAAAILDGAGVRDASADRTSMECAEVPRQRTALFASSPISAWWLTPSPRSS